MRGRDENDHWRALRSSGGPGGAWIMLLKCFTGLFRAVRAADILYQTHETKRRIKDGETSGLQEEARLGNPEDLRMRGMLEPGGFHIGFIEGLAIYLKEDWHVLIMGMAGYFKTTSLTLVNAIKLLQGAPDGSQRESIILLDWKNGELARALERAIRTLTNTTAPIFAPFDPNNTIFLNIFQDVVNGAQKGERIVDEARARLQTFFAKQLKEAGANSWIVLDALALAHLVLVARCYLTPKEATLGDLWDFAQASPDHIRNFMEVASEYDDVAGGFVTAGAVGFLNKYGSPDNEKELRWILQCLSETFSLFAQGSRLRDATSKTTFDVSTLKEKPTAFIISIPERYSNAAAACVMAVLEYTVETVAHANGPHRVSVLAEEASILPPSPAILRWIRVYRSLGVRMVTVIQDRSGLSQFRSDGGHKTFEQNSVQILAGLSDVEHMRQLEQRAGKRTVLVETRSTSLNVRIPGGSHGGHETLTPVLPVSEIARLGPKQALLLIPGLPPFIIDRKPWWEHDDDVRSLIDDTRFNRP